MYVTLSFKFYTLSNRNLLIHLISISIYIISICLFKEFITHMKLAWVYDGQMN